MGRAQSGPIPDEYKTTGELVREFHEQPFIVDPKEFIRQYYKIRHSRPSQITAGPDDPEESPGTQSDRYREQRRFLTALEEIDLD